MNRLKSVGGLGSLIVSSEPYAPGHELVNRGSPVGRIFAGLFLAIAASFAVAAFEPLGRFGADSQPVEYLGMLACTTFTVAGLLVIQRAFVTRSPRLLPVAAALIGPGAFWIWLALVDRGPLGRPLTIGVAVLSIPIGLVLLTEGARRSRWLGLFCGLGVLSLGVGAVVLLTTPEAVGTVAYASGLAVAGSAAMYGTLVELELSEKRSLDQLVAARAQVERQISEAEAVLHDLRSGLLAIETAIGTLDDDLAQPLRAEAARLRHLTSKGGRHITRFDLVPGIRDLVTTRRTGGVTIDLRLPSAAYVEGEESELLAVVENLVTNAQRHGRDPIRVSVEERPGMVEITVEDGGRLDVATAERLFVAGFTTASNGSGIGLGRARMLAGLNRSVVGLEPSQDGNTAFVLRIPSTGADRIRA